MLLLEELDAYLLRQGAGQFVKQLQDLNDACWAAPMDTYAMQIAPSTCLIEERVLCLRLGSVFAMPERTHR
jgi:hypothetical protein